MHLRMKLSLQVLASPDVSHLADVYIPAEGVGRSLSEPAQLALGTVIAKAS